jgi:serine/threonine protein kinase
MYISYCTKQVVGQILDCLVVLQVYLFINKYLFYISKQLDLIHSDLKPENILLDHCLPHVRVIDFGSAAFNDKKVTILSK